MSSILDSILSGGGQPMDPSGGMPADETEQASPRSTSEILEEMIESAKEYLNVEQDEEDKLTMTKVLQQLQQYLAKEQSEADGALQGKVSPRMIRKTMGGGSAGSSGGSGL